jgi:hypothetical protein
MENKNDIATVNESHYKVEEGGIEAIDYIVANKMNFIEGNIVKYITRHQDKDKEKDIIKVINYAIYALKYYYGYTNDMIVDYLTTKSRQLCENLVYLH